MSKKYNPITSLAVITIAGLLVLIGSFAFGRDGDSGSSSGGGFYTQPVPGSLSPVSGSGSVTSAASALLRSIIFDSSYAKDWLRIDDGKWKYKDTILTGHPGKDLPSFLKFDISYIPRDSVIQSAQLEFYELSGSEQDSVSLHYVQDDNWSFNNTAASELRKWPRQSLIEIYRPLPQTLRAIDVASLLRQEIEQGSGELSFKWLNNGSGLYKISSPSFPDTEKRPRLKISYQNKIVPEADLTINSSDIVFSKYTPKPNDPVIISAKIRNLGGKDVPIALVRFFNGPPFGSTSNQIGGDQNIFNILANGGAATASVDFRPPAAGQYQIYIQIDPNNIVPEIKDDNNSAYNEIEFSDDHYSQSCDFEDDFCGWKKDYDMPAYNEFLKGEKIRDWAVQITGEQAFQGQSSVRMFMDGKSDDGTVWLEKVIPAEPNSRKEINFSFYFRRTGAGPFLDWQIFGFAENYDPEIEQDFTSLGGVAGEEGWQKISFSKIVTADNIGKIWLAFGLSAMWETELSFYYDLAVLSPEAPELEPPPEEKPAPPVAPPPSVIAPPEKVIAPIEEEPSPISPPPEEKPIPLSPGKIIPATPEVAIFLLKNISTCIVGDTCINGDCIEVKNGGEETYKKFKNNSNFKAIKPSDPTLNDYQEKACLTLALADAEINYLKDETRQFISKVSQWTNGAILLSPKFVETSGEITMTKWGDGLYLAPWDSQPLIRSHITKQTDFVAVSNNVYDKKLDIVIPLPACGATFGADWGIGGAGYNWIPKTQPGYWFECANNGNYLHEWLNLMDWDLYNVSQAPDIYQDQYPPCGEGDKDSNKWFPSASYHSLKDPDSGSCGWFDWPAYCESVEPEDCNVKWHNHILTNHYNPLITLIGNHCRDGRQDYGETGVDTGGACSRAMTVLSKQEQEKRKTISISPIPLREKKQIETPAEKEPTSVSPPGEVITPIEEEPISVPPSFVPQPVPSKPRNILENITKTITGTIKKIFRAGEEEPKKMAEIIFPPCGDVETAEFLKFGDVDDDSMISQNDAAMIANYLAGKIELSDEQKSRADVNDDAAITIADALLISQYIAGNKDTFPICASKTFTCGFYGDINLDGVVSNADSALIANHLAGKKIMNDSQRKRADVNNDGEITIADVLAIGQYAKGLRDLPVCAEARCFEAVSEHNNPDDQARIDVVFVGFEFDDQESYRKKITELNNGLMTEPPLRDYLGKFNYWYVSALNEYPNGGVNLYDIRDMALEVCPQTNQTISVFNSIYDEEERYLGFATLGTPQNGISAIFQVNDYQRANPKNTLLHEFGHSFGGLYDEYSYGGLTYNLTPTYPNCDIAKASSACSKWCSGAPIPSEQLADYNCSQYQDSASCFNEPSGLCRWTDYQDPPIFGHQGCYNALQVCVSQDNKQSCEQHNGPVGNRCKWVNQQDEYFKSNCIPTTIKDVNIGTQCVDGTGCYPVCGFYNWFRPHPATKMRVTTRPYEYVNSEHFTNLLENIEAQQLTIGGNIIFIDAADNKGDIISGAMIAPDEMDKETHEKLLNNIKKRTSVGLTKTKTIDVAKVNTQILIEEYLKIRVQAAEKPIEKEEVFREMPCETVGKFGEINGDGIITEEDAKIIAEYLAGKKVLSDGQKFRADVTDDGEITIADVLMIGQYLAGNRNDFPICSAKSFACGLLGDINQDNLLSNRDAKLISKYLAGVKSLTDEQKKLADVNNDGKITISDTLALGQYVEGVKENLPACEESVCMDFMGTNNLGDPNRINMVWIGYDFENYPDFTKQVEHLINPDGEGIPEDTGLYSDSIFKNYKDLFNLWAMTESYSLLPNQQIPLDTQAYDIARACGQEKGFEMPETYEEFRQGWFQGLPESKKLRFINLRNLQFDVSYNTGASVWMNIPPAKGGEYYWQPQFLHEFGHSFGLRDEYNGPVPNGLFLHNLSQQDAGPNCGIINPALAPPLPYWCQEYMPINELNNDELNNQFEICGPITDKNACESMVDAQGFRLCLWDTKGVDPYYNSQCLPKVFLTTTLGDVNVGKSCVADTGLYPGCWGWDWFRSHPLSIMFSPDTVDWGHVNQQHIISQLEKIKQGTLAVQKEVAAEPEIFFDEIPIGGGIYETGGRVDVSLLNDEEIFLLTDRLTKKFGPRILTNNKIDLQKIPDTLDLIEQYKNILQLRGSQEIESTEKLIPLKSPVGPIVISGQGEAFVRLPEEDVKVIHPDKIAQIAVETLLVKEENIKKIEVVEKEKKIRYKVSAAEKVKLFKFIPLIATRQIHIDAQKGSVVESRKPWWCVLCY